MLSTGKSPNREDNYRLMIAAVTSLAADERNLIACLSNISAIINFYMDAINWSGFYILHGGELVLGPFQGLPACIRIPLGKGVCGTAASRKECLIVPDVDAFDGHIACDSNSKSEIVLPILTPDGTVYGVLDIDSPLPERFSEAERRALAEVVSVIEGLLQD